MKRNVSSGGGTAVVVQSQRARPLAFSRRMSGTLAVNQIGAGATTLTAGIKCMHNNENAGELDRGASRYRAWRTVNSGAVLSGSGTVGNTTINTGGFLVPGPGGGAQQYECCRRSERSQPSAVYVVQVDPTTGLNRHCDWHRLPAGTSLLADRYLWSCEQLHHFDGQWRARGETFDTPSPPSACRQTSRARHKPSRQ